MHDYSLLEILAIGFTLALVFGYAAQRIGLSPIVGYLVAGFFLGPYTPGFVADAALASQLSEAGIILLMFGVGLHFHPADLLAVKNVALPGAVLQCLHAGTWGTLLSWLLGLPLSSALVLGMGLSVASTVVVTRVLTENNRLDSVDGKVTVGWLVVEDLSTVILLVLLPTLALVLQGKGQVDAAHILQAMGLAGLHLGILVVLVFVVGSRVMPWILVRVIRTRSEELFTLTVLVAAFATAVAAALFFDASLALGAFMGGMVVGKTRISYQAGANIVPLRDALAVLFFLSVGMMFDPAYILHHPLLVLAGLGVVLLVKPLGAFCLVCLLGYSPHLALVVGIGISQIGEFSFILVQQAQALGMVTEAVYKILVICSLLSITLNPVTFRAIPRIERFLQDRSALWRRLDQRARRRALRRAGRDGSGTAAAPGDAVAPVAVIAGYDGCGREVARILCESGLSIVVVDMNVDTVHHLNEKTSVRAVFGDASKREVLLAAGLEHSGFLLISQSSLEKTAAVAVAAKSIHPGIHIMARTHALRDREILDKAGVDWLVVEEKETAATMGHMVRQYLAEHPENIPAQGPKQTCTLA